MSNQDTMGLYFQLADKQTKEKQLNFLNENAELLDSATLTRWLGWVNSGDIPTFRDDDTYKAVVKTLDQQLMALGGEEALYDVQGHLDDIFLQVVQGERWKNADPLERMSMAQDIVQAARQRAGVGDDGGESQPLTFKRQEIEAAKAEEERMAKVVKDLESKYTETE